MHVISINHCRHHRNHRDHNYNHHEHYFLLSTLTVATTKLSFTPRRSKYFGVCLDEKSSLIF